MSNVLLMPAAHLHYSLIHRNPAGTDYSRALNDAFNRTCMLIVFFAEVYRRSVDSVGYSDSQLTAGIVRLSKRLTQSTVTAQVTSTPE